ncbi:MAG TPA: hypothetical protein VK203_04810 [Nostocaceae cyanobacterium]|nr:hypothetical protein [Nostocaceae cyanobacterium]
MTQQQILNLSDTLQNDSKWNPLRVRNAVKYQNHPFSKSAIWLLFSITPKYLHHKLGWTNQIIQLSTHSTTLTLKI